MRKYMWIVLFAFIIFGCNQKSNDNAGLEKSRTAIGKTAVSIQGEAFYINGEITYKGRQWQGHNIEGLLFNSRMVQGIFDDLNPATRDLFKYPDTDV